MKITIKRLGANEEKDFAELILLFKRVFKTEPVAMPGSTYLKELLHQRHFRVYVAVFNNNVVGGLTVDLLPTYHNQSTWAYIRDLAVEEIHQRKGIGQKLIENVKLDAKKDGFEEVFVQADKVDDYALDFYRKTNPSGEEEVVHFYYTL